MQICRGIWPARYPRQSHAQAPWRQKQVLGFWVNISCHMGQGLLKNVIIKSGTQTFFRLRLLLSIIYTKSLVNAKNVLCSNFIHSSLIELNKQTTTTTTTTKHYALWVCNLIWPLRSESEPTPSDKKVTQNTAPSFSQHVRGSGHETNLHTGMNIVVKQGYTHLTHGTQWICPGNSAPKCDNTYKYILDRKYDLGETMKIIQQWRCIETALSWLLPAQLQEMHAISIQYWLLNTMLLTYLFSLFCCILSECRIHCSEVKIV